MAFSVLRGEGGWVSTKMDKNQDYFFNEPFPYLSVSFFLVFHTHELFLIRDQTKQKVEDNRTPL